MHCEVARKNLVTAFFQWDNLCDYGEKRVET